MTSKLSTHPDPQAYDSQAHASRVLLAATVGVVAASLEAAQPSARNTGATSAMSASSALVAMRSSNQALTRAYPHDF